MATTSVDEYVGLKLKIKRSALGITQNELGDMTGITFQQIQKYEKGANRIGAGRLYEFATILNVPVSYFFDGYDGKNIKTALNDNKISYETNKSYESNIPDKEVITLIKFFSRIKDKQTRNGIVNLARSLSKNEQE
ncbi:MAG: helix-turn-helix transcriptional regulator [Rickettsiales bacterium]|nr:helix-turn-helix transcriptional regulator [Rickettsiales bacterium]